MSEHVEDDGTGWARPNASWLAGYNAGSAGTMRSLAAMLLKRADELDPEVAERLTPENARLDRWMTRQAQMEIEIHNLRARLAAVEDERDALIARDEGVDIAEVREARGEEPR